MGSNRGQVGCVPCALAPDLPPRTEATVPKTIRVGQLTIENADADGFSFTSW